MKKILLDMYLKKNLGDDLFLKIISERYPNIEFYIQPTTDYEKSFFSKNIHFIRNFYTRAINVFEKKFKIANSFITNVLKKKNDIFIVLGGSMFIEKKPISTYDKVRILNRHFKIEKPFYILGANFGPYMSEEYYEMYKNVFRNAEDVSFREKHSYELFKDLKNVRVNPDIVFGLKTDKLEIKDNKNVVISIINCEKRFSDKINSKYEKLIIDLIKKFDGLKYNVTLMSFCKGEGDETAIENILNKIRSKKLKEKIKQYNYDGNIDEALNLLAQSSIIVGSRFHANILGLVMNKTIIPIAYSDKTINTLKDINFKGKIIDIRKIDEFDISSINEKELNYKLNVDKYKKESEKHFEKLDEILK